MFYGLVLTKTGPQSTKEFAIMTQIEPLNIEFATFNVPRPESLLKIIP